MNNKKNRFYNQLRLGAVGCGQVFERYHLPAIEGSPDWKLIAVFEPLKKRREWIEKSFQEVATHESMSAFLDKYLLDAVLVSSPPETHSKLSIKALQAGLHVLVEKPMALNYSEALSMLEASLSAQKQLWVSFNRRFRRNYLRLKERLSAVPKESIKAINYILISDSENWKPVTQYLEDDSKGGGILDNTASHQIDLLTWLLDYDIAEVKAEQVAKNGDKLKRIKYILRFHNGLIAKCVAGHGTIYYENLEIHHNNRKLVAYPSGVSESSWIPLSLICAYSKLKTASHLTFCKLTRTPNPTLQSFVKQYNSFADAIRGDKRHIKGADARSGLHSINAIQACRESIQAAGNWKSVL